MKISIIILSIVSLLMAQGGRTLNWPNDTEKIYKVIVGSKVGIGVAAPSAYLHLKAGTIAAGTAPIKFNSGPMLSVLELGALEWDGVSLGITGFGPRRDTLAYLSDLHLRQHSITSTSDHTSSIVQNYLMKANANGLPSQSIVQERGDTALYLSAGKSIILNSSNEPPGSDANKLIFRDTANDHAWYMGYSAGMANYLTFKYDSIFKMYLSSGGDLTLIGTITANNDAYVAHSTTLNNSGGDYDTRIKGNANDSLFVADASTNRVGIGTNIPSHKLTVALGASSGGIKLSGRADDSISSGIYYDNNFGTYALFGKQNNTYGARISSYDNSYFIGGNVGIGTNNPSDLLHVNPDSGFIRGKYKSGDGSEGMTITLPAVSVWDGLYDLVFKNGILVDTNYVGP